MANIFDAVKPILYTSRIVGLAPYSLDSEGNALKVSKIGLIFTTLVLLAYGGVSGSVLYLMIFNKADNRKGMYISEANKICQMACGVGVTIITLLLTLIQRNKMTAVVQELHRINGEMANLNLSIPYTSARKFSIIQVICLTLYITFLFAHDIFAWSWYEDSRDLTIWIAYLAAPLYNFFMESQFILGALLLKLHFSILNDYLSRFNDTVEVSNGTVKELTDSYVDGVETFLGPRLVDPTFVAWDGNFSRFRTRKTTTAENGDEKQTKLAKIKMFRKIHSNLCDIKEFLNTAFSLQLLASVAQAFVIITSDLYLLFTTLNDPNQKEIGVLSYPIVWSITHVLELIFVVVTCTKTSKQANQTAVVVHKLLARDCELDIRNQLKLFSIQLLHRKISFSACGFFTLDMTLLQAIIGAATTYLVILIQFHNTYEKTTPPTELPDITITTEPST